MVIARLLLLALLASRHPLHTTMATIEHDAAARELRISIRVFADDLAGVATAALPAYLARSVAVVRGGRAVALAPCGVRRTGDLLWLCLRGAGVASMAGAEVTDRLLLDRFADQVNIVQASYGARRETMLFTRGRETRRLP